MDMLKTLWSTIQGNPEFMKSVNGWLTIFWIAMIPVAYFMGWLESVTFVSALSLWALVSGHWSAWQAARTEVHQVAQEKKDLEGSIAKRIIAESNLKASKATKKLVKMKKQAKKSSKV